jgi:predicted patatin/cPLA2 family phospholipase
VSLLRFRSEEHPIMDMRKLYDHTTKTKQLDVATLKEKYASSFRVSTTNVTKNIGELISLHDAEHRFEEFLVAGAMLPFIAGEPWIINNNEYYDGGLHYIDPAQAAKEMGATHTLVLHSTSEDKPIKPWGKLVERKFKSLDEHYPGAGTHYLEALKNYVSTYGKLPFGTTEYEGMQLYRLALKQSSGVGRLTMDSEKLITGVKLGYQEVLNLFYQQGRVGILPAMM